MSISTSSIFRGCIGGLPPVVLQPPLVHFLRRNHRPASTGRASNMDRPSKRTRFSSPEQDTEDNSAIPRRNNLTSLYRSITPPASRCRQPPPPPPPAQNQSQAQPQTQAKDTTAGPAAPVTIPSPISLTHIRDLPATSANNAETVHLRDLLGDPMIRECWQFNYLFDVDYLMSQFDEDVRDLVTVKVVHGSWKREAPNRIRVDEACSRYRNVEPIVAYMPEPFGTHHSKMMILLRHDDLAQVIIHTANMIPGDWANMCQAVWRSPLLPLQSDKTGPDPERPGAYGSGTRFKRDLLTYLNAYGRTKTGPLVKELARYDFSAVRAALIASVPSKRGLDAVDSQKETLWGWPALRDILRNVPARESTSPSHIVAQVSSIASLGQTDKWLRDVFYKTLATSSSSPSANAPRYSIIFPTPDEIRRSLNGYGSGGSIHMKVQSAQQQKQLRYLRPYLRQWAGDRDADSDPDPPSSTTGADAKRDAGRRRAAPHIKTYIRFTDQRMDSIDWAMMTSANLSTQAWGAAVNAHGEVRICSWEIGVVVWPGLFADTTGNTDNTAQTVNMVPCFKRNRPAATTEGPGMKEDDVVVGFRMPYDLPLTSYTPHDQPWCATASYTEPDWLGRTWDMP